LFAAGRWQSGPDLAGWPATRAATEDVISDLLERLRRRQWRLTPQRRVIAEVLEGENVHLSAEEVLRRARGRLPEVSLATVYNTLNELVTMGEVLEVSAGGGPKRYDPNVESPHHHLVCTGCGELRDVHLAAGTSLDPPSADLGGYRLTGYEITFRGLCPSCSKLRRPA